MAADPGDRPPAGRAGSLAGYRIGIVVSERDAPSARLAAAAEAWLTEEGAAVSRYPAPAAFEVAQLAAWLAERRQVDAVVACAAIVRGETAHDRQLGAAVTTALLDIGIRTRVPVGNAVLTVETREQADARSGGEKGNRGVEAARAVAGLLRAREGLSEPRGLDLGPEPEASDPATPGKPSLRRTGAVRGDGSRMHASERRSPDRHSAAGGLHPGQGWPSGAPPAPLRGGGPPVQRKT